MVRDRRAPRGSAAGRYRRVPRGTRDPTVRSTARCWSSGVRSSDVWDISYRGIGRATSCLSKRAPYQLTSPQRSDDPALAAPEPKTIGGGQSHRDDVKDSDRDGQDE